MEYQSETSNLDEKIAESLIPEHESLQRRMDEQNEIFATQEKFAEEYGGALKQLESTVGKLAMIDHKSLTEMTLVKQPPKVLKDLISAICMIFGMLKPSWEEAKKFICNRDIIITLSNLEPKVQVGFLQHTKFCKILFLQQECLKEFERSTKCERILEND